MRSLALTSLALIFFLPTFYATEPVAVSGAQLEVEAADGQTRIWVSITGPSGIPRRQLLRETPRPVDALHAGQGPRGQVFFAGWDEGGQRWSSHSRDAGRQWSPARKLETALRLRDAAPEPGMAMPEPARGFAGGGDGRLFIVQFKTVSLPEWRQAVEDAGVEILATLPHHGHIIRLDPTLVPALRTFEFVERVETYHPWYRIGPELRGWIDDRGEIADEMRVRVVAFEWGPEAKGRIAEAAQGLGARIAASWPSGHVLELWVTPDQLRQIAGHDDVMSIDRWTPPSSDMDLVREDAGVDFVEANLGYCGQGVRGEVMDSGFQLDHPDFDGILEHGTTNVSSHGTSTYGIVFGNGDRDGDGNAKGTGHMPCAEQGIAADYGFLTDRFAHTQELKQPPYEASFQTNSWGASQTTEYTSDSFEMDDIVWRLDIAILNSQSNTGNQTSRPQAWGKNVISVGGIRHYDTLDTADDAWAGGASIGPAADGRIKPDINYWYDSIYTTTTGSGYTTGFGGTSAATPESAGVLGVMLQMWSENLWETDPEGASVFERQPHFSTLKALLINHAQQYDFVGNGADLSRFKQGWGRPSAKVAFERAENSLVVDEDVALELNDTATYHVDVLAGESELKVTMVYPDPPGTTSASLHRINDVDLTVTSPSLTVYRGNVGLEDGTESAAGGSADGLNTVENVFVVNPEPGAWTIEVEAVEINQDAYLDTPSTDDVTFALIATGAVGAYTDPAGRADLKRDSYGCGTPVTIKVRDGNVGTSTVSVTVWSDTEPTPETVVLNEVSANSNKFAGEIPTDTAAPTAGDGVLSLSDGDTITVEYIDADDGAGGVNVPRQDTAAADCGVPLITQVQHSGVDDVSAVISWTTDEASSSVVTYDSVVPPTLERTSGGLVTQHAVALSGLQACTVYYYAVSSTDLAGNTATNDNAGQFFHFETLGDFGQGLQPCHEGRIDFDIPAVACSSSLPVTLIDQDLNQDPLTAESWTVPVSSTTEAAGELLLLTETGVNTSIFTASIPTDGGAAVPDDGILQVTDGDLLTVTYDDDDDGTGNPKTSFDTSVADCSGPQHTWISVNNITDVSATIDYTLSEDADGFVEWGPTPALGNGVNTGAASNSHSVPIGPFSTCGRVYFRITSTDLQGNTTVADNGGAPYEFNGGTLNGIVFEDGFETDIGWTLDGEWEIGAPQGLGSAPGDPTAALDGTQVLGHDLSGQGSNPGDYEFNTTQFATSPVIDASGLPGVELRVHRWLNVHGASSAIIDVKDPLGGWRNVYLGSGPISESAWSEQVLDISQFAAGNPTLQIRFGTNARFGFAAGWNVDRMTLRDSSQPTYGACQDCSGAPSFGGATVATDLDPCSDSAIRVSWQAAPSWGTGNNGTYTIYRDTGPGFTPSGANQIATGVSGSSFDDATAPAGVTLYYVVRAENDETCSSGPNNGGVIETNVVYVDAVNATSQTTPGSVGDSLRVAPVNQAHARLTWTPAANAFDYRVYRSPMADTGFAVIGQPADALYEDAGALADVQNWYYLVNAADACGNETAP